MSREAELPMRCSELRARQLALHHSRQAPRQQPAQVEVWRELGEGEAEAQYAASCQAEGVEEVARQPLPQRHKTVAVLRVKVQMVCQNLTRKSCHTRCGNRRHMTHAGCRQCAQMGSSHAS